MKKLNNPPARFQWVSTAAIILLCAAFFYAAMRVAEPHLLKWLPRLAEMFS